MDTQDSTTAKRCTKCGQEYPATLTFFVPDKRRNTGLGSWCRECNRASTKRRNAERRKDPEARAVINSQLKASRDRRRAEYNAAQREYYAEWVERDGKRDRKNERQRNNHQRRVQDPAYRMKIRENAVRQYYDGMRRPEFRLARAETMRRRRYKIAANGYVCTRDDIELMMRSQRGRCWYCQCDITTRYEIEHVVPLKRGGEHKPGNIVLACPTCNKRKNARLPQEWIGRLF